MGYIAQEKKNVLLSSYEVKEEVWLVWKHEHHERYDSG